MNDKMGKQNISRLDVTDERHTTWTVKDLGDDLGARDPRDLARAPLQPIWMQT